MSKIEVGRDYDGEKKAREEQEKDPRKKFDLLPPTPGFQPREIVDTEHGPAIRHIVTPEQAKRQLRGTDKTVAGDEDGPRIVAPKDDPRYQGIIEGRSCLACTHHDKEWAAVAMKEQNFIERLLIDERWQSEWFDDWRIWGICHKFSSGEGLRIVHGDSPATCAASDIDSSKPIGSKEGSKQIPCPHFRVGDIMKSSRAGVHGPTASDAASAYIAEMEANRPDKEKAEGLKRRAQQAKHRLDIRRRAKEDE
jgi:hypothetical protein